MSRVLEARRAGAAGSSAYSSAAVERDKADERPPAIDDSRGSRSYARIEWRLTRADDIPVPTFVKTTPNTVIQRHMHSVQQRPAFQRIIDWETGSLTSGGVTFRYNFHLGRPPRSSTYSRLPA